MSNIKITLIKSLIGHTKKRVATAHSLKLKKINSFTIQPNNSSTQGKIKKIEDLVCTEEVDQVVSLS